MEVVNRASVRTEFKLGEGLSVPVGLFKIVGDPPRPKFVRFVAGEDGKPQTDALTGRPVGKPAKGTKAKAVEEPKPEYRLGVRKADNSLVDVTDQLERIEEEAKLEAVEVLGFIDRRRIPRERIQGSYYLGTEGAPRLFAILLRVLRGNNRAGIVRWTKRKGQTLGVLYPDARDALVISEIAYAAQVRLPNEECLAHTLPGAEGSATETEAAAELVDAMKANRDDLNSYVDRRWQAEHELVARAEAGELDEFTIPVEERPDELSTLEDLLRGAVAA